MAYTYEDTTGLWNINFCPSYFSKPNLDEAMKDGNDKSMGQDWWANLENYYDNKGNSHPQTFRPLESD